MVVSCDREVDRLLYRNDHIGFDSRRVQAVTTLDPTAEVDIKEVAVTRTSSKKARQVENHVRGTAQFNEA